MHRDAVTTDRVEVLTAGDEMYICSTACERGADVCADCAGAHNCDSHCRSSRSAGSRRRCTLPVGPFGMSSTNRYPGWHLELGEVGRAVSLSARPSAALRRTTAAMTSFDGESWSGAPKTTACTTAGGSAEPARLHAGRLSPPRLISSLMGRAVEGLPSASRAPRVSRCESSRSEGGLVRLRVAKGPVNDALPRPRPRRFAGRCGTQSS